jgi:hypothetical protein
MRSVRGFLVQSALAEAAGVYSKVGVMMIRPIASEDRIRELCARAAATDDPDELEEIAAQLRNELEDHSARLRGAVDEKRSRAGWTAIILSLDGTPGCNESLSTYIYIPMSQPMFVAELKNAHRSRDKQTICRLIESIPADRWIYLDGPEAVASYDGARIAAHSYGGSGINTYDRIFLNVLWPDLTIDFLGEYTAEEMQLPNSFP